MTSGLMLLFWQTQIKTILLVKLILHLCATVAGCLTWKPNSRMAYAVLFCMHKRSQHLLLDFRLGKNFVDLSFAVQM